MGEGELMSKMLKYGLPIIQLNFIIFKITNIISWSWRLVLFPLWIWLGIVAFAIIFGIIVAIIEN